MNTAKKRGDIKEKPLNVDERTRLKELEDEVRRLTMERIRKSGGVVCEGEHVKFAFIQDLDEEERCRPCP